MRNIKFYISMVMVIGFFLSVSSSSFAEENYSIDVENIKKIAEQGNWDGSTEIDCNAKIKNNTDSPQSYEVIVNFLNNDNEKIHEESKIATLDANEMKVISNRFSLRSEKIKEINSGYATIAKLKKHILTAKVNKNMDFNTNRVSDDSVEVAYSVKLKNNTDKSMTRNVTIAFYDADNNYVKSETRQATFHAGESKKINNTVLLNIADAGRIAKGHVTIN